MLDGSDKETVHGLRLLTDTISRIDKPLMLWIGAGASAWCGYPLWRTLADILHSEFLKYEAKYDPSITNRAIQLEHFPDFFQICRDVNQQRYFVVLADSLKPRELTPVYRRLIDAVTAINPVHILTTNVDELLEKSLSGVSTVQRSDFERCIYLLRNQQSFVCKLHGSISAIETAVFTTADYEELLNHQKFLELLRYTFSQASVVFLGYGLADKYVLEQISKTDELMSVFGSGPHFGIMPLGGSLPLGISPIRYLPDPDKDHRSAIQVIEEIKTCKGARSGASPTQFEALKARNIHSGHLLSRLYPPGVHHTKASPTLTGGAGIVYEHGLTDAEIPSTISTAMHDL